MTFFRWITANRIPVFLLTAILVITGIGAYRGLPLEAAPDITIPNVFIRTTYRGASPEDIERDITIPIEDELRGLAGIKTITSVSSQGSSFINVEFEPDMDIDDVLVKVKDRVDRAKPDLPGDLQDDPSVEDINISEQPILVLSLSGRTGLRSLTRLAEDLEDDLEAIPGVLDVTLSGGVTEQIQIQILPERLTLYQIPYSEIQRVVARENTNISGGFLRTGEGRYQLRVPGEITTADELGSIVLANRGGAPIYLRDVARIVDGVEDRTTRSRSNGLEALNLSIKKRVGKNIVELVDAVDRVVAQHQARWPEGTRITKVMDEAKNIRRMLADLENNLLSGLVLVVLVVSAAMGLRNGILVSLSIPLSMLITFVVLQLAGITLNMVVLFSLTLALGMLVDNAVVIIENIYRFMQEGVPRGEAAVAATAEVAWPIIGSGATTIVAFVPLLFWTGIMGEFMVYLPQTVIITLASCLFVALVINPVLAAVFMRLRRGEPAIDSPGVAGGGEHPLLEGGGRLLELYRRALRFVLRFRLATVALALGLNVVTLLVWYWVQGVRTATEFFPAVDPDAAHVNLVVPPGVDLDRADAVVRDAAARVMDARAADETSRRRLSYDEVVAARRLDRRGDEGGFFPSDYHTIDFLYEKAGIGGGASDVFGGGLPNQVGIQFVDFEERDRSSKSVLLDIEQRLATLAGAAVRVEAQRQGPPTGAPVAIEIAGPDFALLGRISGRVERLLRSLPFTRNVRSDLERGLPTLRVRVNRRRAGYLGLTVAEIGAALKAAFNGIEVSSYRAGDDEYDIVVRLVDEDRRLIETLSRLSITTSKEQVVPLTSLCTIELVGGLGRITRVDGERVVTVRADVDTTRTSGAAVRQVAHRVVDALLAKRTPESLSPDVAAVLESLGPDAQLDLPPGVKLRFAGEEEEQRASQAFLEWALGVALLLILLVLVSQFNALTYPLIIASAVVLSLSGVFVGLTVFQLPFGIIMTGVGVISLAGVVVNNGIVLLDYILLLERRGLPLTEAIVAGGATRLRPVMLTAVTTVLGLIPMAAGVSFDFHTWTIQWASASSQWWRSMAVAVIFGLSFATLLTLFVVPVLFSLARSAQTSTGRLAEALRRLVRPVVRLWWWPYDRLFRTDLAARKSAAGWLAMPRGAPDERGRQSLDEG